jgi:hypothetical protein
MAKQTDHGELGIQTGAAKTGPVECLGKTFPNDDFKPEYLGKLEFYLEAIDRDVRKEHEKPSVGVLQVQRLRSGGVRPNPFSLPGCRSPISDPIAGQGVAATEAA